MSIKFLFININCKIKHALLSLELTWKFDNGMHLMVSPETASRPLWGTALPCGECCP